MNQGVLNPLGVSGPRRPEAAILPPHNWLIALIGVLVLATAATIAGWWQVQLEYPLMRLVNSAARHSAVFDRTAHSLTTRELVQGVVFLSLVCYLWFDSRLVEQRPRLAAGVAAAVIAGIISRLMQLGLPTHLRPLYTPALHFIRPNGVDDDVLNHFNSFPSDHGAVFFTLALVIYRMRPGLGVAAFVWAIIVDSARVYVGYHYPSDIVGAIGLGLIIVTVFDQDWARRLGRRLLTFEEQRRPLFYMTGFAICYQVATLFDDVREMVRGMARLLLHHDPFPGG
jgi:undecaprenyl-diphosphatase